MKLYTLIWRRFMASQTAPAEQQRTTVDVDGTGGDGRTYTFRSVATVTTFPGFLRESQIRRNQLAVLDAAALECDLKFLFLPSG